MSIDMARRVIPIQMPRGGVRFEACQSCDFRCNAVECECIWIKTDIITWIDAEAVPISGFYSTAPLHIVYPLQKTSQEEASKG